MSDETPSVEELKERLKIEEVPVEEEPAKKEQADIVAEFRKLGRQLAETLDTAWRSEERQRIESEVREGVKSFVDEMDRVFSEAKESPAADRVRHEATEVRTRVQSSDFGNKARGSIAHGLQWMSQELGKLSEQFTPVEKQPAAETETEAEPAAEE